jgi:hypothetical protein
MPRSLSSTARAGAVSFIDKLLAISAANLAWTLKLPRPSRDCRDAAALKHAAYDKVSNSPDIEAVCALATRAGRIIERANPGADLSHQIEQTLASLRHQHSVWRDRRGVALQRAVKTPGHRTLLSGLRAAPLGGWMKRLFG